MRQKKIFLIIISSVLFLNCQNKHRKRTTRDQKIILNCIDTLMAADEFFNKSDYILNPYVGAFEFNNYTNTHYSQYGGVNEGSKKDVFKKLDWNDSIFNSIKVKINSDYTGKCYEKYMVNLSGKESSILITFSGIYKDIVFVEIIEFCDPIAINELNLKKDYLRRSRRNISSLVLLLDDEKVKEIFTDNYISLEDQCM